MRDPEERVCVKFCLKLGTIFTEASQMLKHAFEEGREEEEA
jgi:hypothetical protein